MAAILAVVKLHRRRNIATKSTLILGRDSHKSAYDGLSIADCDAVVLPCIIETEFNIPIGSFVYENIEIALQIHKENVSFKAFFLYDISFLISF